MFKKDRSERLQTIAKPGLIKESDAVCLMELERNCSLWAAVARQIVSDYQQLMRLKRLIQEKQPELIN